MSNYHHRQIIDKKHYIDLGSRLLVSLILLIVSTLTSFGRPKEQWSNISAKLSALNTELECQLRAGKLCSDNNVILLNQLNRIARASTTENSRIIAAYWNAEYALQTDTASSAEVMKHLSNMMPVDSVKYPFEWFKTKFIKLRTLIYLEKNYSEAYHMLGYMLPYLHKLHFKWSEALATSSLGLVYYQIGDYKEALRYMTASRQLFSGLGHPNDSLRNELNICNTMASMGHIEEVVKRLNELSIHPEAVNDSRLSCNIFMSLYYFTDKKEYACKARQQALKSGSIELMMKSLQNLSKVYYNNGEEDKALESMKQVFAFFNKHHNPDYIVPLRAIVDIYQMRNDRDSAIKYMTILVGVQDSLNQAETKSLKSRMKLQQDIANYQINMSLAEARTALAQRTTLIIIIVSVLLITSGGIIWVLQRHKNISDKKLRHLENERLAMNLQQEKMQNEHYQDKIRYQERSLTSKALLLLNKNKLLNDLLDQIETFASSGALPKKQARLLEKKIKAHLSDDSDWNDFTMHFEQVNPQFFETLKTSYPQLTDKDLKLCAYFKLGFSIKQIAKMLSVLPESINTSRYRLRRKMNLERDIAIEDALRDL